jgi:UDP-N-acetylglucosamine 2-epimerase (non-hydrolysing)
MTDCTVTFVLGTRPEIIKTAPVILECDRRDVPLDILHTGQHYSESLDDVFFEQLQLPTPETNLDVGSGSHGSQTGEMVSKIEAELLAREPEVVVVQGDTNSALAGALAGCKLDMEVAHIEAGLRSFDREMPEETNRVLVDHVSEYLFPPTDGAADQLRREGIPDSRITVTGNTIADAVQQYSTQATVESDVLEHIDVDPDGFYLLTAHREENVDHPERFEALLSGVDRYATKTGTEVIYPIHPRAREQLRNVGIQLPDSIRLVEPQDFFDFLRLESAASLVFTDSGGVQEESCILGTPCVTLRYSTERPETVHVGANCIAGLATQDIVSAAEQMASKSGAWDSPFGDGRASERILAALDIEAVPEPPEELLLRPQ